MYLLIDTTAELTRVALINPRGEFLDQYNWLARANQSEELLIKIDSLIKKNQFTIKDLSGLLVNCGPGSYTGLRVGVTTANFLAYSLNIPVASLAKEEKIIDGLKKISKQKSYNESAVVYYERELHITSKK